MKIYGRFITEDMRQSILAKQKTENQNLVMNDKPTSNSNGTEQAKIIINEAAPDENCVYYIANENWNDNFIIIDNFSVYINGLEDNNYIGQVKIYSKFNNSNPYNICQSFLNIDASKIKTWPGFCQIGTDINFYKNLERKITSREYIESFLSIDVIFNPQNLSNIKDEYFINNSFLRDDGAVQLRDLYNVRKSLNSYDQFIKIFTNSREVKKYFNEESNCNQFITRCIKQETRCKYYSISLINNVSDIETSEDLNSATINFFNECSKILKNEPMLSPDVVKRISDKATDVINKVNEIKSILSIDEKDSKNNIIKLGQYTSLSTLPKVIRKENTTLRLTNVRQLNDPLEGLVLPDYLNKKEDKNTYNTSDIFISSATSNTDDLPMWKQYADDCKGVYLIYDKEFINKLLDNKNNIHIYRIAYVDKNNDKVIVSKLNDEEDLSEKEDKIKELLSDIKKLLDCTEDIGYEVSKRYVDSIGYLFKKISYSYENEFRIIVDMYGKEAADRDISCEPNGKYPVPFIYYYARDEEDNKIPLEYQSVVLGPKCMDRDYIEPYLIYCKGDNIEISKSEIANR